MTVKYGQIAGNTSINAMIYRCFEYICEEDQRKFVKKFQEQPHDSDQIMHTFRELVLGGYLSSKGFTVKHDYVIDDQTPDWSILDVEGQSITGIVELANFHIDKASENDIKEQKHARGIASYWRDQNKDNVARLYHSIWCKASVYKSLTEKLQVPYVVGVIGGAPPSAGTSEDGGHWCGRATNGQVANHRGSDRLSAGLVGDERY